MVAFTAPNAGTSGLRLESPEAEVHANALLNGEILLQTRSHTAWGAAVTAQMYLPQERETVWHQLVDYPRWVQYFPDVIQSRVLDPVVQDVSDKSKRLHQVASKSFLFLSAQAEVYLRVFERAPKQIRFCLESGSFTDFYADLQLKDYGSGSLLTYFVQATPSIPVPSMFIQQAIHLDLPTNMRQMRQVICSV